jgi:hypothetical protein
LSGRSLALAGGATALVMSVLMIIGTTSMGLFVTYGVLWVAGAGVLAWGLRREKAETFARLERERHAGS